MLFLQQVTRTIKQDKTRLDQQLNHVSRDYKKRMNQLTNETNKWKEKAEKLRESREFEVLMYSKNTFRQGVCNDGGSHVETSSICAVPLGIV